MKNEFITWEKLLKGVRLLSAIQKIKNCSQLQKNSCGQLLQVLMPEGTPEDYNLIYEIKDKNEDEILQIVMSDIQSEGIAIIRKVHREFQVVNAAWALKGACNYPTVTEENKTAQHWLLNYIVPDITEQESDNVYQLKTLL